MTPALKAMVEAMAAEIARQADADDRGNRFFEPETYTNGEEDPRVIIDAWIDLEKVARAGLKAIREPGPEITQSSGVWAEANNEDGAGVIREAIDAILKETP